MVIPFLLWVKWIGSPNQSHWPHLYVDPAVCSGGQATHHSIKQSKAPASLLLGATHPNEVSERHANSHT